MPNAMTHLPRLMEKAGRSAFYLRLLNLLLGRTIPFNRPHGIRVTAAGGDVLRTLLPYRRRNFNHIRGLHACALATLAEFTTGLLLVSRLDPARYRIIMQSIRMDYHYQGKMDATAEFGIDRNWLEREIYTPLQQQESVLVPCTVLIHDRDGNHLCTGQVSWQVKSWEKVKTKV
jgi:acyl-coenzyme A thioesterase PaaI-like protein